MDIKQRRLVILEREQSEPYDGLAYCPERVSRSQHKEEERGGTLWDPHAEETELRV